MMKFANVDGSYDDQYSDRQADDSPGDSFDWVSQLSTHWVRNLGLLFCDPVPWL